MSKSPRVENYPFSNRKLPFKRGFWLRTTDILDCYILNIWLFLWIWLYDIGRRQQLSRRYENLMIRLFYDESQSFKFSFISSIFAVNMLLPNPISILCGFMTVIHKSGSDILIYLVTRFLKWLLDWMSSGKYFKHFLDESIRCINECWWMKSALY